MLSNLAAILTTVFGVTFWLNGENDAPADIVSNSVVTTSSIDPSGTHVGDLTYYTPGLGACGRSNTPTDMIAAISHKLFDNYPGYDGTNPNNNPVCGRTAVVTHGDKTIRVKVVDRCEACDLWDLDLSPTAFKKFAPLGAGRLHGAKWHFHKRSGGSD